MKNKAGLRTESEEQGTVLCKVIREDFSEEGILSRDLNKVQERASCVTS